LSKPSFQLKRLSERVGRRSGEHRYRDEPGADEADGEQDGVEATDDRG
jgi:hypothetical protein